METLQTTVAKLYVLTRRAKPLGNGWPLAIRNPTDKVSKYPNFTAIEDALKNLDLSQIKSIELDEFSVATVTFYHQDILPL